MSSSVEKRFVLQIACTWQQIYTARSISLQKKTHDQFSPLQTSRDSSNVDMLCHCACSYAARSIFPQRPCSFWFFTSIFLGRSTNTVTLTEQVEFFFFNQDRSGRFLLYNIKRFFFFFSWMFLTNTTEHDKTIMLKETDT